MIPKAHELIINPLELVTTDEISVNDSIWKWLLLFFDERMLKVHLLFKCECHQAQRKVLRNRFKMKNRYPKRSRTPSRAIWEYICGKQELQGKTVFELKARRKGLESMGCQICRITPKTQYKYLRKIFQD